MLPNVIYFIIFGCFVIVCDCKKYNNYTLFRAIPVNEVHMEFFSNLDEFYDVNYWRRPGLSYQPIDFVINPKDKPSFVRDAERHGVYLTTIIRDVQSAFDKQTVKKYIRRKMDSFDWNNYFDLDDIYSWLKDLAKKYHKEMTLENIGQSVEKRDILAARILLNTESNTNRPKVIVEGGIHAREWIAPAVVTYFMNEILHANNSENKLMKLVAQSYEWYFVPVLNVDGYQYTHTSDRLWRKNRNGYGVDLNRNFGYAFGSTGVSKNKRSEIYCGEEAFSEKETRAMANFVKSKSKNLQYYLAFHSYGQYMLLPYANRLEHLDNFDEVLAMCKRAEKEIYKRYHTKYKSGTAFDTIRYTSSGVSGCWVKNTLKVPYVVTFELRDNGVDGFALSPNKILPTCLETMDGLRELLKPRNYKKLTKEGKSNRIYNSGMQMVMLFSTFFFYF